MRSMNELPFKSTNLLQLAQPFQCDIRYETMLKILCSQNKKLYCIMYTILEISIY